MVCSEGYSSSLVAHTLRRLGLANATDLEGGFQALLRVRPRGVEADQAPTPGTVPRTLFRRSSAEPRWAFPVTVLLVVATTGQLAVATFATGLPQFEGKAFGARLVFYPLLMPRRCSVLVGRRATPRGSPGPLPWSGVRVHLCAVLHRRHRQHPRPLRHPGVVGRPQPLRQLVPALPRHRADAHPDVRPASRGRSARWWPASGASSPSRGSSRVVHVHPARHRAGHGVHRHAGRRGARHAGRCRRRAAPGAGGAAARGPSAGRGGRRQVPQKVR